ncbi:ribonuclease HII [Actinomyces howellii]|uniref:Ribonuclease n=1 Tax=Actinomyces howellii TaxID=52771 RepID=A0A448HF93_9ACTO|nr:ribonuclease HII [Actinomyces howellii]VEG26940.1 Ribonuclease HII [Actinomyces howellii]
MRTRVLADRGAERELLAAHGLVGGMDEVGRGSLAGPVTVGLVVVSASTPDHLPEGLADSKQLSPRRRQALVEPCRAWATDHAVCHASAAEIDELGIMGALRLAGRRALSEVASRGHLPGALILDGPVDWLAPHGPGGPGAPGGQGPPAAGPTTSAAPLVRTQVGADAGCAVVAAASVLAKVERDALMAALPDPGYGWASNKGYASAAHVQALARLGADEQHRRSWRLPGLTGG